MRVTATGKLSQGNACTGVQVSAGRVQGDETFHARTELSELDTRTDLRPSRIVLTAYSVSNTPQSSVAGDGDGELVAACHVRERLIRSDFRPFETIVRITRT